ncbi:MAG: hypothetical protein JRI25_19355 [Deltaproteobacteria bacterium]|nr:hypothetical protein [Deltaproteobacteria bacterium]
MEDEVRIVDCYYLMVRDEPGSGASLLEHISERGISLVAFTAIPAGVDHTQLCMIAESTADLMSAAADAKVHLSGPLKAFLIQGNDRIGMLHGYHQTLANAGVNAYSSGGVCDGRGRFGFVIWVEPSDFDKAFDAFGIGG